ncbi:MAG TPA: hypothetical protein QF624_02330 [Dehalococcoidia bacterium]|nr:hypothetical protein [Dehalococcoidia bacterium]
MQVAGVCDVCKLPLAARVTSVQIIPGKLTAMSDGVQLVGAGLSESFTVCRPCADRITDHMHHLVNGENIAEMHPDGGSCPVSDPREHLAAS